VVIFLIFVGIVDILTKTGGYFFSRMLLLKGIDSDTSAVGRNTVLLIGLSLFEKQILFGNTALLITEMGNIAYIHNILSAWQFFGFLPFLMIIMMLIYSACKCIKVLKNRVMIKDPFVDFMLMFTIYALISVLAVKVCFFVPFWLVIGYWSGLSKTREVA
jgi:hypothetical protein